MVALAIPWRATAAQPVSLPDEAAIRARADLWFLEHAVAALRAPSLESPGSLLGTATPAPENPLPARAPGRGLATGALPPLPGGWDDPLGPAWIRPVLFGVRLDPFPVGVTTATR